MEIIFFIVLIIILFELSYLHSKIIRLESVLRDKPIQNAVTFDNQSAKNSEVFTQKEQTIDNLPKELLDYVKKQLSEGVSEEKVKNDLLQNGWLLSDVERALSQARDVKSNIRGEIMPTRVIEPTFAERFVAWLKEDWLMKLGAMLLIIGFAWLTTYAFLNNWIGPAGRIAIGLLAGAIFILIGWWRIKDYINQGGVFLVLGSTTILITTFAAREVYQFFTPLSALLLMFLSTAFVALASVKYSSRVLAFTSLILASIAPSLVRGDLDPVWLFSYLLVVVLGTIWIVFITGKRELSIGALIVIFLYTFPDPFLLTTQNKSILLWFAYAFTAIFFLTNTIGIVKLKDKPLVSDLITAAGNGLYVLIWILVAVSAEWQSLVISGWMIIFATGAFIVFSATKRYEPFFVYAGVGIAMLAAATAIELKGAALTIAYTLEIGIIAILTYLLTQNNRAALRISTLMLIPIIFSFENMTSSAWKNSIFHKDFFVLLTLATTLFAIGLFFLLRLKEENKDERGLTISFLIIGSVYVYIMLWLSLHAVLVNDNHAVTIALLFYTIIGIICYFYGLNREKKALNLYGGVLVGFVVLRLLLVDIWRMELTGRIITFFMIGALLISTAFIVRRRHNLELQNKITQ